MIAQVEILSFHSLSFVSVVLGLVLGSTDNSVKSDVKEGDHTPCNAASADDDNTGRGADDSLNSKLPSSENGTHK